MPLTKVTVITDPLKVMDFVSDLQDRSLIRCLEDSKDQDKPGLFLQRGMADGLYTLLLYRPPKWMMSEKDPGTTVMLFTYNTLEGLIDYFYRWAHTITEPYKGAHLRQILMFLYSTLQKGSTR